MTKIKVIQIGNLIRTKNRDNPQRGRVYSVYGISPTIYMYGGGGQQPLLVEKEFIEDKKPYDIKH